MMESVPPFIADPVLTYTVKTQSSSHRPATAREKRIKRWTKRLLSPMADQTLVGGAFSDHHLSFPAYQSKLRNLAIPLTTLGDGKRARVGVA